MVLHEQRETHICATDPEEEFTSWQTAMSGRHQPGITALSCPQDRKTLGRA